MAEKLLKSLFDSLEESELQTLIDAGVNIDASVPFYDKEKDLAKKGGIKMDAITLFTAIGNADEKWITEINSLEENIKNKESKTEKRKKVKTIITNNDFMFFNPSQLLLR